MHPIKPHKVTLITNIGCDPGIYSTYLLKKWLKSIAIIMKTIQLQAKNCLTDLNIIILR